jgi:predicted TIM-barrel fold metal-dependent hydrolase
VAALLSLIPFVDTHLHFWDPTRSTLPYTFLETDEPHSIIGDIDAVRVRRFSVDEYRAQSRFQNVSKTIHVQVSSAEDPVDETRWLDGLASDHGMPTAIVGLARLRDRAGNADLEGHARFDRVRGIRSFDPAEAFAEPVWRANFRRLGELGFVYSHMFGWPDKAPGLGLAQEFPETTICVDQASMPRSRDPEYFAQWKNGMRQLALAPNTVCKISSLGMVDQQWTLESLRPWVLTCIELFGPERCFFGSNWPMDSIFSSFADLISAYRTLISDHSQAEQYALLSGTAERVYRL